MSPGKVLRHRHPSTRSGYVKAGRILAKKNMKVLGKAQIKEWQDAYREYDRLAAQRHKLRQSEGPARSGTAFTYSER